MRPARVLGTVACPALVMESSGAIIARFVALCLAWWNFDGGLRLVLGVTVLKRAMTMVVYYTTIVILV